MAMEFSLWLLQAGIKLWSKSVSSEKTITIKASETLAVEVNVVTRLGALPVKGVVVKVAGADFGTTDAKGQIMDGAKAKRKTVDGNSVEITASYKNTTEHLREEKVSIKITEIDKANKTQKVAVKHEIPKIRDAKEDKDDVDFKTEYDTAEDLAWRDDGAVRVIEVTISLCTFSLVVPYVNQRASSETINTRPGLAQGKDPEAAAHAINGPSGGKFSGGVLCYPSSVKMLLDYWGVAKQRSEIMQECYDQWAKEKFKERLDKLTTTPNSSTEPATPAHGSFWLDTTADDGKGYKMKRAVYDFSWEALTGKHTPDYSAKEEPEAPKEGGIWKNTKTGAFKRAWFVLKWSPVTGANLTPKYEQATAPTTAKEGEIWKDTSVTPAVLKKGEKKWRGWIEIAESRWRTDVWGGATVWEYGWRELSAIKAFKPADTTGTSAHLGVADKSKFPLSKPAATDTDVTSDILVKYTTWLSKGWPFVIGTTATDGHMMIARGVVLNKDYEVEWLIVNDPYGNLEGAGASYQADEQNATSATGEGSDKGRNAYYRNATLGKDSKLRIKGDGRGFPRIEKTLTNDEVAAKLVAGG